LKELKNDLKQEIAELGKEVREMKEEWKCVEGLEKGMDTLEKNIRKQTEQQQIGAKNRMKRG